MTVASSKMNAPFIDLFFRAILCNWVVCLAVWLPMHVKGDGAKISVMMLLVFAFVASGFEHSVANMVTFAIALAIPHPDTVTLLGAIHNLIPVTLGNVVGGGLFVGGLYFFLSTTSTSKEQIIKSENRINTIEPKYLIKAKV
jgi:nitrite transporter NirC